MAEFFFGIYLPFALGTAVFSLFQLFYPIIRRLPETNSVVKYYYFNKLCWLAFATVLAPAIFPILIVERYRQAYIDGFVEGVKDAN